MTISKEKVLARLQREINKNFAFSQEVAALNGPVSDEVARTIVSSCEDLDAIADEIRAGLCDD